MNDATLLANATDLFAGAAAEAILSSLDLPRDLPTPRRLTIEPPVTDPNQIEFAPPPPGNDDPTRVVIPVP